MATNLADDTQAVEVAERVRRHAAVDRVFHWVAAIAVLTLLGTGLLPVAGVKFPWVTAHWVAGIVLAVAVVFHIVRALAAQDFRSIAIGVRDVREFLQGLRREEGGGASQPARPGKYTLAQKLMHHGLGLVVLTAVASGLPMMAKIDSPFWKRDPYLLAAETWGVIYVLHGLAALLALTLVMIHVYFALLPEKRLYLRAMLTGWITRDELLAHHDPRRWPGSAHADEMHRR